MAKLIGTVMLLWLVSMPVRASAHDAYDDSESNPLRLAAYALYPVGLALEWLVMRPIHLEPIPQAGTPRGWRRTVGARGNSAASFPTG